MKFARDNACLAAKAAATIRQERWTGWDIGRLRGLVWPASQDYVGYTSWKARLRNALGDRYLVLPAAVLDDAAMAAYAEQLRRRRPVLLRGFPSPLYLLANHIRRRGGGQIPVPSIIATGEPLYDHQRQAMQEAFGAKVFDSYGSRETGLIAQECPEHGNMHINAESLFLETVRDEATGRDRLLVTDLLNRGMPMIRYEIGDTCTLSDRLCPCGRGLPLMEMGVGREADILYTPEGRAVSSASLVLYLVDNGPAVGQVQVIQDALDHLTIRITRTPPVDDSFFAHYRGEIARIFGDATRVTFETVDGIPNEASGKYRFAICAIHPEERPS
jgi:phenylacetate-CoA ligase